MQTAWLTPSELFTPHWGRAIASHIMQEHRQCSDTPLAIFELGAGTGTLAKDILSCFRSQAPDAYRQMVYKSIELSPGLARLQRQKLADAEHSAQFEVLSTDTHMYPSCYRI